MPKQEKHTTPKPTRTIYDVSPKEILWRNLLAGIASGFGALLVPLIVITILGNLFLVHIWPQLKPVFDALKTPGS